MSKVMSLWCKRPFLWLGIVIALVITAATVYAVLPAIGLSSPTSFPVDI